MELVNLKIEHTFFGEGKVVSQEADILTVEFSGKYGVKKFIYPDAFEKYLKLYDPAAVGYVIEELHKKLALLEAEEMQKRQEAEKQLELERSRIIPIRSKPASRSKSSRKSSKLI